MEIKNKKKIGVITLALITGISIIGTSVAYFTSTNTKENPLTVGSVRTVLHEDRWDDLADTDHNGIPDLAEEIIPNKNIPKDPAIENTGKKSCMGIFGGQSTDCKYHHCTGGWLTESES